MNSSKNNENLKQGNITHMGNSGDYKTQNIPKLTIEEKALRGEKLAETIESVFDKLNHEKLNNFEFSEFEVSVKIKNEIAGATASVKLLIDGVEVQ